VKVGMSSKLNLRFGSGTFSTWKEVKRKWNEKYEERAKTYGTNGTSIKAPVQLLDPALWSSIVDHPSHHHYSHFIVQ